ncbi:MAG TPA: dihydropteroate synthase [Candidatus Wallbacteria bacterium]|nr:dihydropteroate synthase [Candidatus Wallbacteria bacterium]
MMIYDVLSPAANIIKQEMLSAGGDCAIHKNCVDCKIEKSDIILLGTKKHYKNLIAKLKSENYFNLKNIIRELSEFLNNKNMPLITKLADGRIIEYGSVKLMGIINANDDSFYGGSRNPSVKKALITAEKMLSEGADILDIGGESSRPGSAPVNAKEECRRVVPIIGEIRKKFPAAIISVDTYRADTAREALDAGADIINDITAMRFDEKMIETVAEYNVPAVLMHSSPKSGNVNAAKTYDDLIRELIFYFDEIIKRANDHGIKSDKMIIDPGIGFSKTFNDNIDIIRHTAEMKSFNLPLLIGASRKSFIGKILNDASAEERLEGTIAVSSLMTHLGANIIRVHDVLANARAIKVIEAIKNI